MTGTASDGRHAFSHILVAGSTLWCIYNTSKTGEWKWIYGTYGTLCFYSFVGIWRYGNPRYGNDAINLYDLTSKCIQCFALSCAVTDLYLLYGHELQYAILHCALPCLPLAMHLTRDEWEVDLIDGMILSNIISCIAISVTRENYFGIALGVNFGFCHFALRTKDYSEVPSKILYNAGLCFCAFFAYKALREASIW